MRLGRVSVSNFRNLVSVDIPLAQNVVIVGENGSGKSNLLHAIRLVLDANLRGAARELDASDFSGFASGPKGPQDPSIRISVDLVDFDDDDSLYALLNEAIVADNPLTARISYVWEPDPDVQPSNKLVPYRERIFQGATDLPFSFELRSRIATAFMPALRDVESDLRAWRNSPMRKLLSEILQSLTDIELQEIEDAMRSASERLRGVSLVSDLEKEIEATTEKLGGRRHQLDATLVPTTPDHVELLRSLRILVDGEYARPLASASLGGLNLLYFSLLQMNHERALGKDHDFEALLIEEPEAHLHPHLQRGLTRGLSARSRSRSFIMTTHSPQLVSAATPDSIVRLSRTADGVVAHSVAETELEPQDLADISRYLDATRSEFVFADRMILVEGFAEQVLVPIIAAGLGHDLDALGISVCAVHGTHFRPFVLFAEALGIPWVLITDGDSNKPEPYRGAARVARLEDVLAGAAQNSFVGDTTLEYDLFAETRPNRVAMQSALLDGDLGPQLRVQVEGWDPDDVRSEEELLKMIDRAGGKGRFAQSLIGRQLDAPSYVRRALERIVN